MRCDRRTRIVAALLAVVALTAPAPDRKTVDPSRTKAPDGPAALTAAIDRMLAAGWADAKVEPAGPADDAEYLRRVYLDLVGKI